MKNRSMPFNHKPNINNFLTISQTFQLFVFNTFAENLTLPSPIDVKHENRK